MSPYKHTKPSKRVGTKNEKFVRRVKKHLWNRLSRQQFSVDFFASSGVKALYVRVTAAITIAFSLGTDDSYVVNERHDLVDIAYYAFLH